jgi:AraC-like DNA-binding protein
VSEPCADMTSTEALSAHALGCSRSDAFWRARAKRAVTGEVTSRARYDTACAMKLETLQSYVLHQFDPVSLSTENVGIFQAHARSTSLGAVELVDLWTSTALVVRRTRRLIARSGRDYLNVAVQLCGDSVISQGDQDVVLGPGDFALYETARPFEIRVGDSFSMRTVVFPRGALRLSASQLNRLTAQRISGREGLGAMVSQYLVGLGRLHDTGARFASWHLSEATLDLIAATFADRLGCRGPADLHSGNLGLFVRVRTFIEHRLADPHLDLTTIAAAHYISIRTLQKLFENQGQTVTGWMRSQRLERCRRDLANPMLRDRPVSSIAAQWGLIDAAHFSRLFRSTYGLPPSDYRAKMLSELRNEATWAIRDGDTPRDPHGAHPG